MPEETREERWKRQTDENFALIGRYVQAFETMVDAVRIGDTVLLGATPLHSQLASIVLNHQTMSARPLFDIFRAMVAEIMKPSLSSGTNESDALAKESQIALGLLGQIATDYEAAITFRNDMLHSTWFIGWASSEQEDFSEIDVMKLKVTKEGLRIKKIVENKEDVLVSINKCNDLTKQIDMVRIGAFFRIIKNDRSFFSRNFLLEKKKWIRVFPS